jgi:hypothetical protein
VVAVSNYLKDFLTAESTSVKIDNFTVGLVGVTITLLNEFDADLIARGTSIDLRRIVFAIGIIVVDVERVGAIGTTVVCSVRIRVADARRAVRMTCSTGNDRDG